MSLSTPVPWLTPSARAMTQLAVPVEPGDADAVVRLGGDDAGDVRAVQRRARVVGGAGVGGVAVAAVAVAGVGRIADEVVAAGDAIGDLGMRDDSPCR